MPQPLRIAGSTLVAAPILPKLALLPVAAGQVSTDPVVVGLWAAGFSRSQSTTQSRSLSVQPRDADATSVAAGLLDVNGGSFEAKQRYLPELNFTAAVPLANTS